MLTRDHISTARLRYLRIHGTAPAFLFLSLDAHSELLDYVRRSPEEAEYKSLQGCKFFGMEIHVVPTLMGHQWRVA